MITQDEGRVKDAYHLAKNLEKLKVKWNGNFLENPLGNYRLPPDLRWSSFSIWNQKLCLYHYARFSVSSLSSAKAVTRYQTVNSKCYFIQLNC